MKLVLVAALMQPACMLVGYDARGVSAGGDDDSDGGTDAQVLGPGQVGGGNNGVDSGSDTTKPGHDDETDAGDDEDPIVIGDAGDDQDDPIPLDDGGSSDPGELDAGVEVPDASVAPDAGTDPGDPSDPADAGTGVADAGTGTVDAGTPLADCAVRLYNVCWYFGALGQSCNTVCSTHGGFDTRTLSVVGTALQGGSQEECKQVLKALGVTNAAPQAAFRTDGRGFGCHIWDNKAYWLALANNPMNPSLSSARARIACGCKK